MFACFRWSEAETGVDYYYVGVRWIKTSVVSIQSHMATNDVVVPLKHIIMMIILVLFSSFCPCLESCMLSILDQYEACPLSKLSVNRMKFEEWWSGHGLPLEHHNA